MPKERKGIIFIVSVLTLFVGLIVSSGQLSNIIVAMKQSNKFWLLLSLCSIISYWLLESKIIQISLSDHHELKFLESLRLSMIGQFFSGVTPFSTGGQPAQIMSLKKMAIPASTSSSALLGKFVVYQFTLVVYTGFLLLLRTGLIMNHLNGLISFVWIGFAVNLCVILFLITISYSKAFNKKMSRRLVYLLYKVRVIREKDKTQMSFDDFLDAFHNRITTFRSNKSVLIHITLLTIMQLTAYLIVPYFIYRSFGLSGVSILDIAAATSFVMMLTSFIPLPGASGGAEGGFYLIFSLFFISKFILPALLLWRLLTYYLWMGIGGIWMLLHRNTRRVS